MNNTKGTPPVWRTVLAIDHCPKACEVYRVAVLGETSGRVRDAFLRLGHNATSYDLLPSDVPGPHVQGDYMDADLSGIDIIIAHPSCTYLCNSGVRWLHTDPFRWEKMRTAARHFRRVLELPARIGIAVENPIMHKYAVEIVGRRQDQVIQPWQFGHGETKATGLWLRGLPPLVPTNIVAGRDGRIHRMPPGPDRWKRRSETYRGIADAMAAQWGRARDYHREHGERRAAS